MFWLYNAKHDRAEMRAQQASQATAVNPVSTASQSDPEQDPPHEASSVVYGLPASKDTGDLAMEWGVWVVYERTTEPGDPSQIESRLPALMAESKKIADMPMHDACAQATQLAEVSSMDADIVYFKAKMESFNTHAFNS